MFAARSQGGHGKKKDSSSQASESKGKSGSGCLAAYLLSAIILGVITCVILQLTGTADIVGFIKGLFGG